MKVSPSVARNLMCTNVYNHVNWLLAFSHASDRLDFEDFKVSSTQKRMFAFAYFLFCYYFLNSAFSVHGHYPSILSMIYVIVALTVNVFIGTVVVLYKFRDVYCGDREIPTAAKSWFKRFESAWIVGVMVCFGLLIIQIGYNGKCASVKVSGCNYSGIDGKMPEDIVFAAIVMPIFVAMAVKGATWRSVIVSYAIALFSVLFTVLHFDMQLWWSSFIIFACASLIVLYDHQRQLIAVYLLTRSQGQLLAELEQFGEEMNAKELRTMIANVAHDLKTPMAAIVNGLDYCMSTLSELASEATNQGKVIAGIKALLGSVNNMKNVNHFMIMSINRCIDYSKATNGVVLLPHQETVKLVDLLFLPIDCMRNLMEGKIAFELQPIAHEISSHIITDKQWLQENLLCLLSNAGKYSSEGTVKVSLSLSAARELQSKTSIITVSVNSESAMFIRVDVEDTGIGISDEVKANLFTPFKQAQRLAGGTGLGLYSLAKRMEALKGYYGVQNRRDGKQGSNFWFAIPYRPDDNHSDDLNRSGVKYLAMADPVALFERPEDSSTGGAPILSGGSGSPNHSFHRPAPASPSPLRHTASPSPLSPVTSPRLDSSDVQSGGLRILLVDDSMSILKITGMMLRKLGHSVTTAENGAVALKKLGLDGSMGIEELPVFDCVLMDLQMPVMDGLEATKRIRAFERGESSYKLRSKPSSRREQSYHELLSVTVQQVVQDTGRHQMVLGVSACSDTETIQAAYAAGIDGFISKPFSKESFNESYLRCKTAVDSMMADKLLDIV